MTSRIDLSDNTNAWGMPPAARRAIVEGEPTSRYPTPYADDFKAAVAAYARVPAECVTTGCGSDDVLDSTMRALSRPGDRITYELPTFSMIPVLASLNGLDRVPTSFAAHAKSGARLIYVCSPNNPTGAVVSRSGIETLLGAITPEQIVIVDEAYVEFSGSSVVDLTREHPGLVVTRTMSKAFGLAGLRAGYAIANRELIERIEVARGPYKVSAVAERASVAALTEGQEWMREHASLAAASRDRLTGELRARGLEPQESAANFVFTPMPGAAGVAGRMAERGVRVRAFADPDGLRLTVGPWPMMIGLLATLDEAIRCE